ncbi:Hsp70 family protein [Marinicella sp. S1101]|uniref:Hsp70 family protein n=1 Tax=Marinicella marina TaxID=2996016 RepID=UPI002260BFB8|nr:Hsp70 family protein [Marinicella marina]MCX7552850.1 Hsp70 family protein [Marinicella marina]MDJ1139841.1 Hsp70 family protein [Marinicella marina]
MIIGIDLGTTNSVCAIYNDHKVTVIPNSFDELLTPSCISFEKNGTIHVGKSARTRAALHPKETVAQFKRFMGSEKTYKIYGKKYTPVELSSIILQKMVADAEAFTQQKVTEAVISVPAYFNGIQRKSTIQAAAMIDLKVEKLINEPTAAAIAYGLQNKPEYTDFMIIDLGGGTFDVSIMEYFDDILEVKASGGDNHLGGEDFLQILVELYCQKAGIKVNNLSAEDKQAVYSRMELFKKEINKQSVIEPFIKKVKVPISITGETFENACRPLVKKIIKSIELCLKDAQLTPQEIEEVILVGGSSRLPFLKTLVTRIFKKIPRTDINPDLTIAHGAAIQAALKGKNKDLSDVVLTDVCPYTLGTGVVGNSVYDQSLIFSPIIERNTVVPASRVQSYVTVQDNQTKLKMAIYQGESRLVKNNIKLGEFEVKVPKAKAGEEMISLRISYDINGILEVDALVESTGDTASLLINNSPQELTEEQIAQSKQKLSLLKVHPRDNEAVKEVMWRAESIYENSLDEEREALNELIMQFQVIIDSQDPKRIAQAVSELSSALESFEANRWL